MYTKINAINNVAFYITITEIYRKFALPFGDKLRNVLPAKNLLAFLIIRIELVHITSLMIKCKQNQEITGLVSEPHSKTNTYL